MPHLLVMIKADALPEGEKDEEFIVVEPDGSGESPPDDLPSARYGYVSTVAANYLDVASLVADIESWWVEATGRKPSLEIIAESLEHMSSDQRRSATRLARGKWSYRRPWVAYPLASLEARQEAAAFILRSCLAAPLET